MNKKIRIAGIFGALAVNFGAFGAHGLKEIIDATQLTTFKVGVQYHLMHAILLLVLAFYLQHRTNKRLTIAFWVITTGILLFSGSLYLLSTRTVTGLTSWQWLGPITPLGGTCLIVGWLLIAFSGLGTDRKL